MVAIYWATENKEGRYLLHAFKTEEDRRRWLMKTEGLELWNDGWRGYPNELTANKNPMFAKQWDPITWH